MCLSWDTNFKHDPKNRTVTKRNGKDYTFSCELVEKYEDPFIREYYNKPLIDINIHSLNWDVKDNFWEVVVDLFKQTC